MHLNMQSKQKLKEKGKSIMILFVLFSLMALTSSKPVIEPATAAGAATVAVCTLLLPVGIVLGTAAAYNYLECKMFKRKIFKIANPIAYAEQAYECMGLIKSNANGGVCEVDVNNEYGMSIISTPGKLDRGPEGICKEMWVDCMKKKFSCDVLECTRPVHQYVVRCAGTDETSSLNDNSELEVRFNKEASGRCVDAKPTRSPGVKPK